MRPLSYLFLLAVSASLCPASDLPLGSFSFQLVEASGARASVDLLLTQGERGVEVVRRARIGDRVEHQVGLADPPQGQWTRATLARKGRTGPVTLDVWLLRSGERLYLYEATPDGWRQGSTALAAPRARGAIDRWVRQVSPGAKHGLHVVYFTPADRAPLAEFEARLTRVLNHVQAFYAREFTRHGLPASLPLERTPTGGVRVHLVRGAFPAARYQHPHRGMEIAVEAEAALRTAGVDPSRETVLYVSNLGTVGANRFAHSSPYGGLRGKAWAVDAPFFTGELRARGPLIHDGTWGTVSLGRWNSIYMGGLAHELAHAFGVRHCAERPAQRLRQGRSLLGFGNMTYGEEERGEGPGSFLTLASALQLASHPAFSGRDARSTRDATWGRLSLTGDAGGFELEGSVRADSRVHSVVAYVDPAGGDDYDALTLVAPVDFLGSFWLRGAPAGLDHHGEMRLAALHVDGHVSWRRVPYRVDLEGAVDTRGASLQLELSDLLPRIASGRAIDAAALASLSPRGQEVAFRLQRTAHTVLAPPSRVPAQRLLLPLSDTGPERALVGWLNPVYDRVPTNDLLLEAGGRVFRHGIYAHAPAQHHYHLGKAWARLSGNVALAHGHRGSVRFTLSLDGTTRWSSPVVLPGEVVPFSVSLRGAELLELRCSDGGDGRASDWGLWLEPTLAR